jgi:hypothetical protein
MSLWRRTRTEVAGAWRSLRYDMGRRPVEPAAPPTTGMDVTSTGMHTFGGPVGDLTGTYDEDLPRRPRRLAAVSAFAVLALAGGVGSYFAVVHGLGPALAGEQPAHAPADAPAAVKPAAARPAENEGMGRGKPVLAAPQVVRTTVPPAPVAVTPVPATHQTKPATECDCLHPPVPTPTAPSGSPSPTPSASATASPSASATSASPSASGSPSASSSESALQRKKRHPRGY